MRIPKIFTPRFSFGVSGVSGVFDSTDVMKNKVLQPIAADTPTAGPSVSGVSEPLLIALTGQPDTPATPSDVAGVAEDWKNNRLNLKDTFKSGTPDTPDTPVDPLHTILRPDTGPLPEGLTAIEARFYQAIAAHPGLSRSQLCERAGLTLDEFNASTPALCGRDLAWPDFTHYGGWITARQVPVVSKSPMQTESPDRLYPITVTKEQEGQP